MWDDSGEQGLQLHPGPHWPRASLFPAIARWLWARAETDQPEGVPGLALVRRGAALLCLSGCGVLGEALSAHALSSVLLCWFQKTQENLTQKFLWIAQTGLAGTSPDVEPGHSSAQPRVGSEFHFEFR